MIPTPLLHPIPGRAKLMSQLEKYSYLEFYWPVFSHIWSETEILPYSIRMWENVDQKNSDSLNNLFPVIYDFWVTTLCGGFSY